MELKVLFIGDIVGKSGRTALSEQLPFLAGKYPYDLLIVNGENAAHGKGITKKIYDSFIKLGVDCVTLGNHAFSKDNIFSFINDADHLIRPANMYPDDVGNCYKVIDFNGYKVGIFNIYGSIFMQQTSDDPFQCMEDLIEQVDCDVRIVDFHGEATSEKYAFMHYFKNECQMIVGTHTHIQTADEDIYDKCAFICDVGMTGPYLSVLGRDIDEVLEMFTSDNHSRYQVSENPGMLCGVYVTIDLDTRAATSITRIQIRP